MEGNYEHFPQHRGLLALKTYLSEGHEEASGTVCS